MWGRRLASNFTFLSVGELLSKILGFLAFTLLARVMGPALLGSLEFTIALILFFQMVADLGSAPFGAREIARDKAVTGRMLVHVAALRFVLSVLGYLLLIVFVHTAIRDPLLRYLILIYGLTLFAAPGLFQWVFQGHDRMSLVALGSLIRQTVFACLVLVWIRNPGQIRLIPWFECVAVAALVLCNVILLYSVFGQIKLEFSISGIYHTFRQALPIGLSELTWAATWYFPTILIGLMIGGAVVGWFGAALRPVLTLHTFVWLYFYNMLPSLSRAVDQPRESLHSLLSGSLRLLAWPAVFIGVAGTIFAHPALVLVFGAEYEPSVRTFQILIWVLPLALMSGHYRYVLIAFNHQRFEFLSSFYTAILSVGLGAALIPGFGSEGAAVSLLIAAAVNWILAYHFVKQQIEPVPVVAYLARPLFAGAVMWGAFIALQRFQWWIAGGASVLIFAILFLIAHHRFRGLAD